MGFKLTNQGSSKRLFFLCQQSLSSFKDPSDFSLHENKIENVFSREEWRTPDPIQSSIKTKIGCLLTFYNRTTFRNHPNSNCSKRTGFFSLFPHQNTKFTRLKSEWDRIAIVGKKKLQLLQLFYCGGILIFCCSTAKASPVIMLQSIFHDFILGIKDYYNWPCN